MNDVIKICDSLWGATITNMDFDFLKEKIMFELVVTDLGAEADHRLEIRDYDSFLWLEKPKCLSKDYDFKSCDYYELTSIGFQNIQVEAVKDKWLSKYPLEYNLYIEIWESTLLVKAKTIKIDNIEYSL